MWSRQRRQGSLQGVKILSGVGCLNLKGSKLSKENSKRILHQEATTHYYANMQYKQYEASGQRAKIQNLTKTNGIAKVSVNFESILLQPQLDKL